MFDRILIKIKQYFHFFIPRKRIDFLSSARHLGYHIDENETEYVLSKNQTPPISLRKTGSDQSVFQQVFIEKEYEHVIKLIAKKINQPRIIIDCGANIGLTSIELTNNFSDAKVYAVEADFENFSQLQRNVKQYSKILPMHNAIWSEPCVLQISAKFRDGLDWSKQTVVGANGNVNAITLQSIIDDLKLTTIDFLKIDIEGAEKELFKNIDTASFLKTTKIMALEIHDDWCDRAHIYSLLDHYQFKYYNMIELTICVNKKLI